MQKEFRTIVISDVHIGMHWSKTAQVTALLRQSSCQTLILCGDIVDDWAVHPQSAVRTEFFDTLCAMARDTSIIYVYGNHDTSLRRNVPPDMAFLNIEREAIYQSGGRRYYVLHGDEFDPVSSRMRAVALLGDVGYVTLLALNIPYNAVRRLFGKPYFSIANAAKQSAKKAVSQLSGFEHRLAEAARAKGCTGVICGHIHRAEIRTIEGIEYLNSGDWVESMTALREDHAGNWTIYKHP